MNPRLTIVVFSLGLLVAGGAAAQKPQPYDQGGQKPPRYDLPTVQKPPLDEPPPADRQGNYYRGPVPVATRGDRVYAVEARRNTLRVRVSSNGCTKKADFRVQVTRFQPARITFVRRTPDRCRSFAMGSIWLEFTYQDLGISGRDDFVVTNPLTAWTGPGN